MAGSTFDSDTNTYRLDPGTQDFSLVDEHGQGPAHVTGNALDNLITGNDADNTLDGLEGADTLRGGLGNDTYFVDQSDDAVIEADGEGSLDLIIAYASHVLPDHVEILELRGIEPLDGTGNNQANDIIGNNSDNLLYGLDGDDRLFGSAGNDTLIGGAGADSLWGGDGDDAFIVDGDDAVVEDPNGGSDRVIASFSYTLGDHLENLRLTGSLSLTGRGNVLDNALVGAQGNDTLEGFDGQDTLDGGAGADNLAGGAGDDLYRIDDVGDLVVEIDGQGQDRVETLLSYSLTAFVEDLLASGSAAIRLTGNTLANRIHGNAAANTLDGGAGADSLAGGAGNDTYIVDAADVLTELAGEGIDTVLAGFSCTLGEHLENLTATGSDAIRLTGNAAANTLVGNAGSNVLVGLTGNDRLDGGGGNDALNGGTGTDVMIGGAGNDTFHVDRWDDRVVEYAKGGIDRVIASVSYRLGATSSAQIEKLIAAAGKANLALTGNKYANTITGNAGANKLSGGLGNDVLKGGIGRDSFVFDTKPSKSTNVDRIVDFNAAYDSFRLDNAVFANLGKGSAKGVKFSADMFVEGKKAKDAEDRIVYDKGTGALYYDADGTGSSAQVKIATIANKTKLYYHDFFVI